MTTLILAWWSSGFTLSRDCLPLLSEWLANLAETSSSAFCIPASSFDEVDDCRPIVEGKFVNEGG